MMEYGDDALVSAFAASHRCRVSIISLKRNASRWAQAEAVLGQIAARHDCTSHLRFEEKASVTAREGTIELLVHPGVDGHLCKHLLLPEEFEDAHESQSEQRGQVDAEDDIVSRVESHLGFKVYRGWSICDEFDVLRVDPEGAGARCDSGEISAGQAWLEYADLGPGGWFGGWKAKHRSSHIDYFYRHLTLGDCGSGLAHLNVAEAALQDHIDVQIIFEDDSVPSSTLLPALFTEIIKLERVLALAAAKLPMSDSKTDTISRAASSSPGWDLIFLRSSLFDVYPEDPMEGTSLFVAGHRKCMDAYVLSASGARKIAESGLREEYFIWDDFIPALFSHHPRPDVGRLSCVRKVRAEGFKAFTFADDAPLSTLGEVSLTSQINGSPCLLGDHGVETES